MPAVLAQTMVEYGLITAAIARITAAQQRLETYIGSGNTKYLLIGGMLILLLVIVRRRRTF